MTSVNRQVELLEKNKPRQERAKRTYERILVAAAELLIEVGVERISTNIIAERAGITVPALYRYFPNKYAVLHAMGATLMDRQNAVVLDWFEKNVDEHQLAGLQIMQSLRAVAPLQEVRLSSNRLVAEQFAVVLGEIFDWEIDGALIMQARLSVEMGYAAVELALEDSTLPAGDALVEGAKMIQAYWKEVLKQRTSA
jgi:AcrR family transcriptional regulator